MFNIKYQICDENGQFIDGCSFDEFAQITLKIAKVKKDEKWALITDKGNLLTEFEFDGIKRVDFQAIKDFLIVSKNNKETLLDYTGNQMCDWYESISFIGEKIVFIRAKLNNKFGLLDFNFNKICDFKYDVIYPNNIQYSETSHLIKVMKNGLYNYIDLNGKEISEISFSILHEFQHGFAQVAQNTKWTFLKENGELLTEFKYNMLEDFSEGLAIYILNGKCGYLNEEGKEICLPQFESAKPFKNGRAAVKLKGRWIWINKEMKKIRNLTKDEEREYVTPLIFRIKS